MIEIALSLAVIGFALVAIIGVLPIGMNVQKVNREETIINQEATVFMDAIRSGAQGLDDLTNYVMAITNWATPCDSAGVPQLSATQVYGYASTGSTPGNFPILNGYRIVGLLSTPQHTLPTAQYNNGFTSNHVMAYVRSMSGAASDKFPQNNTNMQDLAFSYRLTSEVVPFGLNYFDPSWTNYNYAALTPPDRVARYNYSMVASNLQVNLHDVRLYFRWPLRSGGNVGVSGQSFRTLVGGYLQETNEPGFPPVHDPRYSTPYDLYFLQPGIYVKAP